MRRLLLTLALLLVAVPAAGQRPFTPRTYVVGDLPSCVAAMDGWAYVVTDGSSGSDCATGGGTSLHWCVCDGGGAAWAASADVDTTLTVGTENTIAAFGASDLKDSVFLMQATGEGGVGVAIAGIDFNVYDETSILRVQNTDSGATATDGGGLMMQFGTTELDLHNAENDDITISPGVGTEAIRIEADGDVGIGTTSIGAPLHLKTDSAVTTTPTMYIEQDGVGDASLTFLLTGITDWSMGVDNGDNDNFKISTDTDVGSQTKMTIAKSTGNIGIGTTSPAHELDVYNGSAAVDFRLKSASGDASIYLDAALADDAAIYWLDNGTYNWLLYQVVTSQNFNLYDYTFGGTVMQWVPNGDLSLLPAGGEVGINADPTAGFELDVQAEGANNADLRLDSASGYAYLSLDSGSGAYPSINYQVAGSTKFQTYLSGSTTYALYDNSYGTVMQWAPGGNATFSPSGDIILDPAGNDVDVDGRITADGVSQTDANLEPEECAHFTDVNGISETSDNTPVVTLPYAYTVTRMGCHIVSYTGSAGSLAFEDNNGNALTHTAVACQQGVTEAVFQNCTGGCAMAANETLQFDVTNGSTSSNANPIVTACYTVD